jgi:hypothetical protein
VLLAEINKMDNIKSDNMTVYMYKTHTRGVSDCCLMPTQQFSSYIMARTSYLGGLSHAFNSLQFALSRQYLKLMFISFPLQDLVFFSVRTKTTSVML